MISPIPDIDEPSGQEGAELSKIPIDLKSGDWLLKVVPWIGGRIISMTHLPTGMVHLYFIINGLRPGLQSHCTDRIYMWSNRDRPELPLTNTSVAKE